MPIPRELPAVELLLERRLAMAVTEVLPCRAMARPHTVES